MPSTIYKISKNIERTLSWWKNVWESLLQGWSFPSNELSTKKDRNFTYFFIMGKMLSYNFYRGGPSSLMKYTLNGKVSRNFAQRVKYWPITFWLHPQLPLTDRCYKLCHAFSQKWLNVGQSLLQGWSFPSNKINTITGKVHAFFNNGKMFGNHFYRGGPSPLMS